MKARWRLIIHPPLEPAWNMAVDSAMMQWGNEMPPTLRLYRWKKPAVTVGYFQDIEKEIQYNNCRSDDIPIIRRMTGGGAVFHHEEMTYSIVHPIQGMFAHRTVIDSYSIIARPFVSALSKLGVSACYSPINDIIVHGKKISGSAQTRKGGILLQHGTILVAADVDRMFHYITIDPKKAHEAKPVITLCSILSNDNKETIYERLISAIVQSFSEEYAVEFTKEDITQKEEEAALYMEETCFSCDDWNWERLPLR